METMKINKLENVQLYDCQAMAAAIVYGITGQKTAAEAGPDAGQEPINWLMAPNK